MKKRSPDNNRVVKAARAFVNAADELHARDMILPDARSYLDAFDTTFQALVESIGLPQHPASGGADQ